MKLSDVQFISDQCTAMGPMCHEFLMNLVRLSNVSPSLVSRMYPDPSRAVLHVRPDAKLVIKVSSPAVFYELARVTSFPSDVLKFSSHESFKLPTCPGLSGLHASAIHALTSQIISCSS